MNNIELTKICIDNVLVGVCRDASTSLGHMQQELSEVIKQNGAAIKGIITRILEYKIIEKKEVVTLFFGVIVDKPVVDIGNFRFYHKYDLDNIYCFSFRGKPEQVNAAVEEISNKLNNNRMGLMLTGKVHNHIKSWSKLDGMVEANIYIEMKYKNSKNL